MCLKIQAPWPMPEETQRIGQKLLKEQDPYRLVGDQLFEQVHEEEYADLYSAEGKPGISPVILAFVSVFQYLEKLADRQAVVALRMRLDWKYALHLPLDYEGFDFSVLSEFRDRLIAGQAEGRVFEKLVEQIRALGLIKEHGKQRTDSIAMLTKVRRLCRVETVVETLRLAIVAIVAIVDTDREWSEEIIPPSWEEKYGERFVRQRYSEKEWKEYEDKIGEEGQLWHTWKGAKDIFWWGRKTTSAQAGKGQAQRFSCGPGGSWDCVDANWGPVSLFPRVTIGDFDGNGADDILVQEMHDPYLYFSDQGDYYTYAGNNTRVRVALHNSSNYVMTVGEFDGLKDENGQWGDDIYLIFRPTGGGGP